MLSRSIRQLANQLARTRITSVSATNHQRLFSTKQDVSAQSSETENSEPSHEHPKVTKPDIGEIAPPDYRFIFPEFLPNPDPSFRHPVREKLERMDMLARRAVIEIPEFYTGSVLAVTAADPNAPGKENRFVGICISRSEPGLRAMFVLRNIVDGIGIEIMYDMYNPTIHSIEVLKLERRIDDDISYLRDCAPEHSTFPFDMEPEVLPEGAPVPLNKIQLPLNPRPWTRRWDIKNLQGLIFPKQSERRMKRAAKADRPWIREKYDLMAEYRKLIPEEDQKEIFADVHTHLSSLDKKDRRAKRRKAFVKPIKTV